MKGFTKIIIGAALLIVACVILQKHHNGAPVYNDVTQIERDTVVMLDTIRIDKPVILSHTDKGYTQFRLPKASVINGIEGKDSLSAIGVEEVDGGGGAAGEPQECDSIALDLPIIQRHYADSTYEAWVSGPVDPRLDSVKMYGKRTLITEKVSKPAKRWHLGLSTGVGWNGKEMRPYIGVGFTYSIFSW